MIGHAEAAKIALQMLETGVEGAETLARYVDEQSSLGELTDRELTLRAWRRSDEACYRLAELERRLGTAYPVL